MDNTAPVFKFLLGEGPLRGVEFGDRHPDERGAFWWRKDLRAALAAQPAASAEPSDEEIEALAHRVCTKYTHADDPSARRYEFGMLTLRQFARALLSRYGRPAGDALPVRWLVTGQCGHDEYTRDAGEAHRVKEQRDKSYCGEDETRVVPIYAAPVAAQKADDARDAERYRWLRSDKGYSYGNPKTVGRFEVWQHTQLGEGTSMSGCYLDAAIDAAISAQHDREGK